MDWFIFYVSVGIVASIIYGDGEKELHAIIFLVWPPILLLVMLGGIGKRLKAIRDMLYSDA